MTLRIATTRYAATLALVALLVASAAAPADVIELHAEATASAASITLGDIARLDGDAALARADVEVATFTPGSDRVTVSSAAIRKALTGHGVHWGLVTMRGPRQVEVTRRIDTPAKTVETQPIVTDDTAALANPVPEVATDDVVGRTVRQLVRAWAEQATGVSGQRLRLKYHDEHNAVWSLNEADRRLELEPETSDALGRVPMTLRVYDDTTPVSTERLMIDVSIEQAVAIAARTIHRGQLITEADVEVTRQWIDSPRVDPVSDASMLVGQQAARLVRPGNIIEPRDVESPVVIKRGQLITVRALSGGLVIRTVARAQDDGAVGEVISVRNVRTRDEFVVEVTGPQEAVMAVNPGGDA